MWTYRSLVALVLGLITAYHTLNVMHFMDIGKKLENHHPGKCKPIPGTEWGSEDIQTLEDGIAFISSVYLPVPGRRGKILLYDFNDPGLGAVECPVSENFDRSTFWPHGISVWENKETGAIKLFVVNHSPSGDRIEKFNFLREGRTLVHEHTIVSEVFTWLNDIVATGENSFYFTNTMTLSKSLPIWLRNIIILFRLIKTGNTGFYDDGKITVLNSDINFPNGIARSLDNRYLYIAGWTDKELHVFKIKEDKKIDKVSTITLQFDVDNLDVDSNGDIWCSGQPIAHEIFNQLMTGASINVSSQVILLRLKDDGSHVITDILKDNGEMISASSVTNRYLDKIIIGTVNNRAYVCDLHKDSG